MICQKCSRQIPDDSRFCPECGARVEREEEQKICPGCGSLIPADSRFCPNCNTEQTGINAPKKVRAAAPVRRPQPQRQPQRELTPEEAEKMKKRNQKIGIGVAAAAGICVIAGIVSIFIKPSINLNKYVTITAEGYDTVGKASAEFDSEQFTDDYGKKLSSKSIPDKERAAMMFLSACVDGDLDQKSGLSNGDIITFVWDCDDDYALETYGYKLKYSDIEFDVENLQEAKVFDPFDGIEVTFEGVSPKGTAVISGTPTERAAENFRYEIDNRSNLSNGDTVTVTVSLNYGRDPVETCIENYGMIPSALTKTYTVEGLGNYIQSLADISKDSVSEMQTQAKDVYLAYTAKNWKEGETLKSLDYLGSYLLVNKDSASYRGNENMLYQVYQVTIHNNYTNSKGETYDADNRIYWYIAFSNLIANPDGTTTVNLTDYKTPGDRTQVDSGVSSGWWSTQSWRYYGYGTLDDLTKVVVTANAETYRCESDIDAAQAFEVASEEPDSEPETEEEEVEEAVDSPEPVEFADASDGDGFIFPDSDRTVVSAADAAALSDEDLRYAINEIYARHGYIFKDETVKAYFEQFDWYTATVAPANFSDSVFTDAEKENIKVLQAERDKR